jgi:titin
VTPTTIVCTPAAPSAASATHSYATGNVVISWTDNSYNETGFKIYMNDGQDAVYTLIATTAANATSYTNTAVACGYAYGYRIVATNAAGDSSYTLTNQTNTVECIPSIPTNLAGTAVSQTQINLAWTDASYNETGFKIYVGGTLVAVTAANVTTYSATGLTCNTQYGIWIKATNAAGDSSNSNVIIPFTLPCTPAAPSGLTGSSPTCTSVNLAWIDNATNETGYYVYRSGVFAAALAANITSYTETVTQNTAYSYFVTAYNSGGSSNSNSASVSTNSCVVAPTVTNPSAVTVIEDPGRPKIILKDVAGDATSYLVYVNNVFNGDIASATVTSNNYSPTNLTCPGNYILSLFGYKTDTSVTLDASCNELNAIDSSRSNQKKCALKIERTMKVNYCTRGFFGN